jgi:hypothetical protein
LIKSGETFYTLGQCNFLALGFGGFAMRRLSIAVLSIALVGMICTAAFAWVYSGAEVEAMRQSALSEKGGADSEYTNLLMQVNLANTAQDDAVAMRNSVPTENRWGTNWNAGEAALANGDTQMTSGASDESVAGDLYDCAASSYNIGVVHLQYMPGPYDQDEAYNEFLSARDSWEDSAESFHDALIHAQNAKTNYESAEWYYDQCN